jgi:hypothetical protein
MLAIAAPGPIPQSTDHTVSCAVSFGKPVPSQCGEQLLDDPGRYRSLAVSAVVECTAQSTDGSARSGQSSGPFAAAARIVFDLWKPVAVGEPNGSTVFLSNATTISIPRGRSFIRRRGSAGLASSVGAAALVGIVPSAGHFIRRSGPAAHRWRCAQCAAVADAATACGATRADAAGGLHPSSTK